MVTAIAAAAARSTTTTISAAVGAAAAAAAEALVVMAAARAATRRRSYGYGRHHQTSFFFSSTTIIVPAVVYTPSSFLLFFDNHNSHHSHGHHHRQRRYHPTHTSSQLCIVRGFSSSSSSSSTSQASPNSPQMKKLSTTTSSSTENETETEASTASAGAAASTSTDRDDEHDHDQKQIRLERLQELASKRCTPLSLEDMYKYAVAISSNNKSSSKSKSKNKKKVDADAAMNNKKRRPSFSELRENGNGNSIHNSSSIKLLDSDSDESDSDSDNDNGNDDNPTTTTNYNDNNTNATNSTDNTTENLSKFYEQRLRNAQFLHKELPIRMAQRAVDLMTLPYGLNENLSIRQVAQIYINYVDQFLNCPIPFDKQSENEFTDMLQKMVLSRSEIPNAIAMGVDTWLSQHSDELIVGQPTYRSETWQEAQQLEDALYRFFTARVGLRFLTEHHILSSPSRVKSNKELRNAQTSASLYGINGISSSSSDNDESVDDDDDDDDDFFLGCIKADCNPVREVSKVVKVIEQQTRDYYGACPEIQIVDATVPLNNNNNNNNGSSAQKQKEEKAKNNKTFTYVPHHLHYIVGELLKNSCRATVKRHVLNGSPGPLPPIKVVIVKGAEDVTIKVADRGGGIPRSNMNQIWKFAHSTEKSSDENDTEFGVDVVTGSKGLRGFGLPLARIYARYLGGELTLKNMEGYGMDAYLHMNRLGDACENLPLPVKFSPSNLTSTAPQNAPRTVVRLPGMTSRSSDPPPKGSPPSSGSTSISGSDNNKPVI